MPGAFSYDDSLIKTPTTATRRSQPDHDEMHPSKIQQSTARAPDSGLRLGFTDIEENENPSTVKAIESTPSKSTMNRSSAGFDFKWNKEDDLSSEAQKIMESVREEAAKIKEKLQTERDKQAREDEEADHIGNVGQRKFAKPKGKAGRFSDAHKEEFKKMDSIANHVSVWKNQYSANTTSLKRSNSKAGLGDLQSGRDNHESNRLENTAPGKRIKASFHADVSSARPVSRDSQADRSPTKIQHLLPRFVTTPTKASLARSASVKTLRTSKIPSLTRSKSTKDFASPVAPKTEGSNKYLSSLKRVTNMRSILQRPQRKFSNDPIKIAAGTHLPTPKETTDFNKELPSLPGTPHKAPVHTPSIKRVGFALNSKAADDLAAGSPSPSKIPSFNSKAATDLAAASPSLSKIPSLSTHRSAPLSPSKPPDKITYPNLQRLNAGPLSSHPPGDFSFRSSKPMDFGPATSGVNSPTIRHVRPSGIATPISAFENLPAVPHGMPNKKRRRIDEDDDKNTDGGWRSNEENQPPADLLDHDVASPAKKMKGNPATHKEQNPSKMGYVERRRMSKAANVARGDGASKERKGLSLSRLNMLARPKDRR